MAMIVSLEPGWGIADDDAHGARDTVVGFAPVRGLGKPNNTWHMFVRQHPSETYAPIRQQLWDLTVDWIGDGGLVGRHRTICGRQNCQSDPNLAQGVEAISQGTYESRCRSRREMNSRTWDRHSSHGG